MTIDPLLKHVVDKNKFQTIEDFLNFSEGYLAYISQGKLQAEIVSRNENKYLFFQYDASANYNISRPINSDIFLRIKDFHSEKQSFLDALHRVSTQRSNAKVEPSTLNRVIYTA